MAERFPVDNIDLEYLQQYDNLELLARHVVEGFITGLHKSPFHGFSVEFAEHRLYNTGESTRHIDWKLYARTDRLYTKRYEEETNLRCQLLIDNSSSMAYPENPPNKIQFSVYCAAAIAYMLKKQRDAVGLTIFSDKIEEFLGPKSNQVHMRLVFSHLERLLKMKEKNKTTSTAETLHLIAESIHRRSLVILFSDMLDNHSDKEQLFSALQHLKYNKHEVIIFHVMDKKHELDFDFENRPYEFIDLETGNKVKLFPEEIRKKYTKQIGSYRKELKLRCDQYHIDYVEADINAGFRQVLLPYLLKRTKML